MPSPEARSSRPGGMAASSCPIRLRRGPPAWAAPCSPASGFTTTAPSRPRRARAGGSCSISGRWTMPARWRSTAVWPEDTGAATGPSRWTSPTFSARRGTTPSGWRSKTPPARVRRPEASRPSSPAGCSTRPRAASGRPSGSSGCRKIISKASPSPRTTTPGP